tara:strand:+ start:1693 stop:2295 length:603 start_codon:yes stop_codon:yes gene_type:complete
MSSKTCVRMTNTETSILDILIHVFILSSILSIFFLVVIVPLEKNELNNEVNKNIGEGAKHFIEQAKDTYQKQKINAEILIQIMTGQGVGTNTNLEEFDEDFIKRLQKYYEGESETNIIYNKGLITNLATVIGFLLISIVTIYFIFKNSCGKCPKIFTLIGENLILFSVIGIIEYIFFIKFASKYIPIKPSLIIKTVNESL